MYLTNLLKLATFPSTVCIYLLNSSYLYANPVLDTKTETGLNSVSHIGMNSVFSSLDENNLLALKQPHNTAIVILSEKETDNDSKIPYKNIELSETIPTSANAQLNTEFNQTNLTENEHDALNFVDSLEPVNNSSATSMLVSSINETIPDSEILSDISNDEQDANTGLQKEDTLSATENSVLNFVDSLESDESITTANSPELNNASPDLFNTPNQNNNALNENESVLFGFGENKISLSTFKANASLDINSTKQNDSLTSALSIFARLKMNENHAFTIKNKITADIAQSHKAKSQKNALQEFFYQFFIDKYHLIDIGRKNIHNGIAIAFNPNDYLAPKLNSRPDNLDPQVNKNDRLGTVAITATKLFDEAALTITMAPKLNDKNANSSTSLELESTNEELILLISFHLEYITNLSAQTLVFLEQGNHPQFGFNLSFPLSDEIVSYGEYSIGKKHQEFNRLMGIKDKESWHEKAAIGLRWNYFENITLTAEYLFDDSAFDKHQIQELKRYSSEKIPQIRQMKLFNNQLYGKTNLFARVDIQNFIINKANFSYSYMYDIEDSTNINRVELSYPYDKFNFAIQYTDSQYATNIGKIHDYITSFKTNYSY